MMQTDLELYLLEKDIDYYENELVIAEHADTFSSASNRLINALEDKLRDLKRKRETLLKIVKD